VTLEARLVFAWSSAAQNAQLFDYSRNRMRSARHGAAHDPAWRGLASEGLQLDLMQSAEI
jgi:hypothetical protein